MVYLYSISLGDEAFDTFALKPQGFQFDGAQAAIDDIQSKRHNPEALKAITKFIRSSSRDQRHDGCVLMPILPSYSNSWQQLRMKASLSAHSDKAGLNSDSPSSAFTSSYWASGQPSVSRSTGLRTELPAASRASRKSSSSS